MGDPAATVGYFVGDETSIRLPIAHDGQIRAADAAYTREGHPTYNVAPSGNLENLTRPSRPPGRGEAQYRLPKRGDGGRALPRAVRVPTVGVLQGPRRQLP